MRRRGWGSGERWAVASRLWVDGTVAAMRRLAMPREQKDEVQMVQTRRKTDYGTVILHAALVVAVH